MTTAQADVPMQFPLTISHHSDAGNSFLDRGRHAWSTVTISDGGRVDVTWRVKNNVALNGYCFVASYFFLDGAGNILTRHDANQMCVNGTLVPGRSSREQHFAFQLGPDVTAQVRSVGIAHGPGSKPIKIIVGEAIRTAVGIIGFVFPQRQMPTQMPPAPPTA